MLCLLRLRQASDSSLAQDVQASTKPSQTGAWSILWHSPSFPPQSYPSEQTGSRLTSGLTTRVSHTHLQFSVAARHNPIDIHLPMLTQLPIFLGPQVSKCHTETLSLLPHCLGLFIHKRASSLPWVIILASYYFKCLLFKRKIGTMASLFLLRSQCSFCCSWICSPYREVLWRGESPKLPTLLAGFSLQLGGQLYLDIHLEFIFCLVETGLVLICNFAFPSQWPVKTSASSLFLVHLGFKIFNKNK